MQPSPPQSDNGGAVSNLEVRRDLLAGLVLVGIAAFFLLGAGEGALDWIFPSVLGYGVGIFGIILVIRSLFGFSDLISVVPPIMRGEGVAVAVFILIMVLYALFIRPVGFWPVSAAMIFLAAAYLAPERSRRSATVAAGTAIAVSLVAYFTLEYVFYVPFPEPRWLPF